MTNFLKALSIRSIQKKQEHRLISIGVSIYLIACVNLLPAIISTKADATIEQPATTDTTTPNEPDTKENIFGQRQFSLNACFEKADRDNKEIALASSNLAIDQAGVVIAKALPNPTFNLTYGFGPAWKYIIAGNNEIFGWNEEIQVAGRRTKKVGVARANYLQTAFEVEAVRFDVHNRVRKAYAELSIASAYFKLINSQKHTFFKLLDIAQKRYNAGKAPGTEVMQAKLNVVQLNTQRNEAQSRLIIDSAQLAFLLGDTPSSEEIISPDPVSLYDLLAGKSNIVPNPDTGIPPLEQLLPTAWHERKDLKAAIQQAYQDRKALTLAKTQRIPDPFVGFNYLFTTYAPYQTQYFTPQPNAHKVPYSPGYMVTVAEETPIFYHYQGQVNQAKATWIQQLKQNDQIRAQAAADIVTAYEALSVNIENLHKFQRELLPAALQAAQLSRRSYEMGKTDLSTAILAQQQYGQMVSSYFDTAVAYQSAWSDMEKAVGLPIKL
jgi:cobalt-zinc-cadmium efflux system outer membrane protein